MNDIEIVDATLSSMSEYGLCGYKDARKEGYRRKLDWLKQRFAEGMKYKVLRSASEGPLSFSFVEYIPGEYAWRAVEASGYMVIHCINVYPKYRGKGYGSLLLEECLSDAKKENMRGVAVVTSKRAFMAGKELFLKNGFELVDEAAPSFELLVRKLADAPSPRFKGNREERLRQYAPGLTIVRSDQCPYIAKSAGDISETAQRLGVKADVIELKTGAQAQDAPSAYGLYAIVYDGKLLADYPISSTRFTNIMSKVLQ